MYYRQIDALRAFAAFGVINLHWLSPKYLSMFKIPRYFPLEFGAYGVQLFFVLSGFLITEILLKQKRLQTPPGAILKNFYVRRILRLLPIYYLYVLCVYFFFYNSFVIDNIGWFLAHLANIKLYMAGGMVSLPVNHLWTLSIEEQFYLLFPLVLIFAPKKAEYLIPSVFIVLAVITRIVMYEKVPDMGRVNLLTTAQTDFLGAGVLLAMIKEKHPKIFGALTGNAMGYVSVAMVVWVVYVFYYPKFSPVPKTGFIYLLLIAFALLVANTVKGFGGWAGRLLENRQLLYLGKISYGLYLYHKIIPLGLHIVLVKLNITLENVALYYVINLIILLVVTHFSWVLLESQLLKLKSRFEYRPQAVA
ncbi:MAG: acyltransferase [Flavobacteriales bacterium]|nr:acyltransferase [Flavobacteriales bacterium]